MRKMILALLILVLALGVGVASAQDMDLTDVDPSGATVTYWHQYREESEQGDTIAALIAEFNEMNEYGITVEGVYQGSYGPIEDLMATNILTGELPNLVAGYANAAANWYNEGIVVDLEMLANDPTWGFTEEETANFNYNILDVNVTPEGQRIAWANQNSFNVLYVNLDMVERLGFERRVPATLDEFRQIACASAEAGSLGYPINGGASELETFVAAFGGEIYDEEAGAYDFTAPAVVETLEFFKGMYDDGCAYFFAERFQNQADFANGLTPLTTGSSAGIPFFQSAIDESGLEDEWVVTSMPGATEDDPRSVQIFVPSQVVITSTPENIVATWLFVKFLAQQEQQLEWASNTGYLSTRTDVELTADNFMNPAMPFDKFQAVIDMVADPDVMIYASPALASYSGVRGILESVVADITTGEESIEDVTARLNEEAAELQEDLD